MKVLLERFPYRFLEGDDRGCIEKFNETTGRWNHFYECDSSMQLVTAMEDNDYVLWLDNQPCYRSRRGNSIKKQ